MNLEVVADTLQEDFLTKMVAQHANGGRAFQIGDVIENLVDFQGVANWYFDRVRRTQRVQLQG
jgi:hypothetical protein